MTDVLASTHTDVDALLDRLDGVRNLAADHWIARCPAHDDRRPSLDIRLAHDGKILLCCRPGCRADEILQALGLDWAVLFPDGPSRPVHRSRPETEPDWARHKLFARATRTRERRKAWLPIWLGSDHVRELMRLVMTTRSDAITLGDTPGGWTLLAFAAAIEVEAFNTEAGLDAVMAERRRA